MTLLTIENLKISSHFLDLPTFTTDLSISTQILLFLLPVSSRRIFCGILTPPVFNTLKKVFTSAPILTY